MSELGLCCKNVKVSYPQFTMELDFSVKKGELVALIGPSGSGKSTTLSLISGLLQPQSGSILINGKDVTNLTPDKRKIAQVFQDYALFPHMNVEQNIAYPMKNLKMTKEDIKNEVSNYLDLVNLSGYEKRHIDELSGGEKQRVALARALASKPDLLLLDEPLSALDAKLRANLLLDLDALHDKIGITFIYVTHDQSEALAVSDRIAVMNSGHVLQVGTPYEIYEQPATQFVAQFIGETNLFESTVVQCDEFQGKTGTEYNVTLNTPALGTQTPLPGDTQTTREEDKNILVTDYERTEKGQKVAFTIRPEKIRITTEIPNVGGRKDINVFKGIVEEPVYTGFQSKFYVRLENGTIVKVFKQHTNYLDDGPEIAWKDTVYISWSSEDGYIVEDINK